MSLKIEVFKAIKRSLRAAAPHSIYDVPFCDQEGVIPASFPRHLLGSHTLTLTDKKTLLQSLHYTTTHTQTIFTLMHLKLRRMLETLCLE